MHNAEYYDDDYLSDFSSVLFKLNLSEGRYLWDLLSRRFTWISV